MVQADHTCPYSHAIRGNVPVKITVGYAGQQAVPRPFLLVMDWVKVGEGWKMASDIAIPVPLPPTLKP